MENILKDFKYGNFPELIREHKKHAVIIPVSSDIIRKTAFMKPDEVPMFLIKNRPIDGGDVIGTEVFDGDKEICVLVKGIELKEIKYLSTYDVESCGIEVKENETAASAYIEFNKKLNGTVFGLNTNVYIIEFYYQDEVNEKVKQAHDDYVRETTPNEMREDPHFV